MKNITYTLLFTLAFLSCKAQTPVIPLFNGSEYLKTENAYYKDTDYDFNRFIGTWKYTNGNQEFTIILKKKQQYMFVFANKTFYEDVIYGEYQYDEESGNTLVNSLSNIDNSVSTISDHLIFGNSIIPYKFLPDCEDCTPSERRISLRIQDPERSYLSTNLILRTVPNPTLPNVNDLELTMTLSHSTFPDGSPTLPRILEYRTYYRLIKQ